MVQRELKRTLKWAIGALIPVLMTFSTIRLAQAEIPPEDRISNVLLEVAAEMQSTAPAINSLPRSDSLLISDDSEAIAVRVVGSDIDQLLPHLAALGFEVIASSPDHLLVEGLFPIDRIQNLPDLVSQGFMGVLPVYLPVLDVGAVTSEADIIHEAARARATGSLYDGTGISIGVLSDSYNNLGGEAADIGTGDLPATLFYRADLGAGGSDEGRAMTQLAFDLAPGASFGFATAFTGEAGFAANIQALAANGADVIVDDVVYFAEPFFQDGIVAQAVDTVFASGVTYFSSAGNRESRAYESAAFDGTSDTITGLGSVTAHDFDPSGSTDTRQRITLANGERFRPALQWDDPFYTLSGVDTDLDFYLLDASGNIVDSSADNNLANQTPYEQLDYTNFGASAGFDVVIVLAAGPAPGSVKYVNFGSDVTINEFDTDSPTVNPHAAASGGMAVAAAFYGDHMNPESFTSHGPSTFLFDSGGNPLGSPEVRQTPDFTAIDGANNTFFGDDSEGDGFGNFFGTSAAAPHAAALAALIRDANPGFTPTQVYSLMSSTADDITSSGAGFDNVTGAGLVNVYDALYPVQATTLNNSFTEGFESGVLGDMWETHTDGPSQILVTPSLVVTGTYHVTMDTIYPWGSGLNELILHLDLRNGSNMRLSFDQREWGDEDNPMSTMFSGSENSDGVALSVDGGTNWYELVDLTGAASTASYQRHIVDLSQFANDNSLTLGADVRIKFQQYDNFPITNDGFSFDEISVTSDTPTAVTLAKFSAKTQADRRPTTLTSLILFVLVRIGAWFVRQRRARAS